MASPDAPATATRGTTPARTRTELQKATETGRGHESSRPLVEAPTSPIPPYVAQLPSHPLP